MGPAHKSNPAPIYFMDTKLEKYWLILFLLGALLSPGTGHAANVQVELSAGYDDNPSQTEDANGSAFGRYSLSFDQYVFYSPLATTMDFSLSGTYQDYHDQGDNYRIDFFGDFTHPLMKGRVVPSLSIDAGFYRDDLLPEDERDELGLNAGVSFLMSTRTQLALNGGVRWLDYRNESLAFKGAYSAEQRGKQQKMQTPSQHDRKWYDWKGISQPACRDDRLDNMNIELTIFAGSSLTPWLTAGYARLHSNVEVEAYRKYGLAAGIEYDWNMVWHLELALAWHRTEYDKAPYYMDRIDYTNFFETSVSRFFDSIEVFLQFEYKDNDSEIDVESYTQWVTQCGFCWSF